jgi:hypothetical protein
MTATGAIGTDAKYGQPEALRLHVRKHNNTMLLAIFLHVRQTADTDDCCGDETCCWRLTCEISSKFPPRCSFLIFNISLYLLAANAPYRASRSWKSHTCLLLNTLLSDGFCNINASATPITDNNEMCTDTAGTASYISYGCVCRDTASERHKNKYSTT